tara:strand:+ start:5420 stop:5920 length:501 start_codon:yes stop_codon:yes gene_type:complete
MLGWLKAKKDQRQREGDCDFIIAAILHSRAQAEVEIRRLEAEVDRSVWRGAAVALMQVVIECPRTVEDVKRRKLQTETSYAAGKMRLQHYIGRHLGLRLVGCGALLLKLQGDQWMRASFAFAELEGFLHAFVTHYRVKPWEGTFAYDKDYERYRLAELARREAEDA